MRTPRVAILVLFFSASLFFLCRSISSARRPSPAATSLPAQKSQFRAFFSFTSPFSLFPPSAAISLTDDNSTFFPARPAAFGPPLPAKGLNGQLWIGSGFSDEALQEGEGEGELGCSDIPGWEDRRSGLAIKAAVQGSSLKSALSVPAQSSETDDRDKGPAAGRGPIQSRRRHAQPKALEDGTDDHLHQDLLQARSPYPEGTSTSRSSHADIQSMQETAEITGKVALLSRGGCGFLEKVKWAQRRGAIALIVGDNQKGGPLIQMYARGNVDNVTIPSVFTSRTTAHLLSSLMQPGSFIEDILGGKGDPMLKVQRSAKAAGGKNGRPALSARTSASGSPGHNTKRSTVAKRSWLSRLFYRGDARDISSDANRPPSSGRLDWVLVNDQGDTKDKLTKNKPGKVPMGGAEGSSKASDSQESSTSGPRRGLFSNIFGGDEGATNEPEHVPDKIRSASAKASAPVPPSPNDGNARDGLWVTITPTGSASPFFDTLLVLVISPLITLTVVYALLILRVKIRMRRWRAPKSVVDQLPVRTYHTVAPSPSPSPRVPSPSSSSPTTPLLQGSSRPRSRSHITTGVPDAGDLLSVDDALQTTRPPPHEKPPSGVSSEWRKHMGRQVECVVCLEEYVDGVSRVMSLPCGHEFHAECM